MEMTPRERVMTSMNRRVPDRVPRWIDYSSFAPGLMAKFREKTGAADPAEYYNYETRSVCFKPTQKRMELMRYIPKDIPKNAEIDWEWGNVIVCGDHRNVKQTINFALGNAETVKDIEDYPMPDFLESYRWEHIDRMTVQLKNRQLAVMGFMSQTIFEVAWGVRGFENFLIDLTMNKDIAEMLVERITQIRCKQAEIFARSGVDILRLGDDFGTERGMMISPDLWREYFKHRFARIIKAARELKPDILVFYHSDGDCREIIPELIEIGVDILNPVQPECMDPAVIKNLYGEKLSFWGTIGTQTTMPFGTPNDVKDEVKLRIETVGAGGGLFLGPTHLLQDEVPWENVQAFFDAVDEFGIYK